MWAKMTRVRVERRDMRDEELLALFAGGPDQAAVKGVMEICQRLEDQMIAAGVGERDAQERAALMRDIGTVREIRNQMLSFAVEAQKRGNLNPR